MSESGARAGPNRQPTQNSVTPGVFHVFATPRHKKRFHKNWKVDRVTEIEPRVGRSFGDLLRKGSVRNPCAATPNPRHTHRSLQKF